MSKKRLEFAYFGELVFAAEGCIGVIRVRVRFRVRVMVNPNPKPNSNHNSNPKPYSNPNLTTLVPNPTYRIGGVLSTLTEPPEVHL